VSTLRLLLVEDSPDDELFLLRALKGADLAVEHVRVETGDALSRALETGAWDVVISDFHLPHLDACMALELVHASKTDLPFIVVSGTVGEDFAVDMMRRGAHDYVMKSNLRRLPETIRREVKEARHRRERRSFEEQARRAQKMEAVGQLASGVAHDFNNLLTVMISFSQFVHDDLPEGHAGRGDLKEVVECGNRAALLTRQLLAFSRKSVYDPQLLDLNELIASSEKMLKRLLGVTIDYATMPSREPAWLFADRSSLEQVLVNLIVNARDAMPKGGKLTVETARVDTDAGPRLMLAISDTGVGMPEDVQKQIFEPFFTTKGPGRGTGLGLSTVQAIVQECKAELSLHSAVGRGTTFKIFFPPANHAVTRATAAKAERPPGGSETVLVVEDQEPVRIAVKRALCAHGYRVIEAARPLDALKLIEAPAKPVQLVLTDMVLPEMSGAELVERVRQVSPHVAVLFMSGFAAGALAHQGAVGPGTAFLQKPFTPDALVHKVRAALDAKETR
jgi:two-component system cell cycle sensor histidine kinase/response regulator CckA